MRFEISETRRLIAGLAVAGLLSVGLVGGAGAQQIAAGGNGGGSNANADGGSVTLGDTESGGSSGSSTDVAGLVGGAVATGSTDSLAQQIIASILGN